jgi:hypothetical protein
MRPTRRLLASALSSAIGRRTRIITSSILYWPVSRSLLRMFAGVSGDSRPSPIIMKVHHKSCKRPWVPGLIRASLNATVGIELGRWWVEQGFVVIEARQVDMPRGDHEEGRRGSNDDGSSKSRREAGPVGTPIIFELSLGGHNGPRWMQDQYQKRDAKVRGRKTMGPTVLSPKEKGPGRSRGLIVPCCWRLAPSGGCRTAAAAA